MHCGLSSPFLQVLDERALLSAGVGVRSTRARVARWKPAAAPSANCSISNIILAQSVRQRGAAESYGRAHGSVLFV